MKRILLFVCFLLVAGLIGGWLWLRNRDLVVKIPQQKVDETLAERFPISKTYYLIFQVSYENPVVELLEESNRIRVGLNTRLRLNVNREELEFRGGATVTTGVRYEPDQHAFFLTDIQVERLTLPSMPEMHTRRAAQVLALAAQEFLPRHPIYQIEGKATQARLARMLLKEVRVEKQTLYLTLGL